MDAQLNEEIEAAAIAVSRRADAAIQSYFYEEFEIVAHRKSRRISAPSPKLKALQQRLLLLGLRDIPTHFSATAYRRGCSIAANARRHAGNAYLFKTDVADFFPSVRIAKLQELFCRAVPAVYAANAQNLLEVLTLNEGLAQGAPTSPHLSNVFMSDFDKAVAKSAYEVGVKYTRYADDIAVSGPDEQAIMTVSELISERLADLQLQVNDKKTRLLGPDKRKIVTGLDVTTPVIRPTRKFRKKTKALVRAYIKYGGMARVESSTRGRLAFWNGVSPQDPELRALREAFYQQYRSSRTPSPLAAEDLSDLPF